MDWREIVGVAGQIESRRFELLANFKGGQWMPGRLEHHAARLGQAKRNGWSESAEPGQAPDRLNKLRDALVEFNPLLGEFLVLATRRIERLPILFRGHNHSYT